MLRTAQSLLFILIVILGRSGLSQSYVIYKMRIDGGARQQIVTLPQGITRINGLAISRDASQIAWALTVGQPGVADAGVYISKIDGSQIRKLPLPAGIRALTNPSFSPDGKKLLVTESDGAGHENLALVDMDGGGNTVIVTNGTTGSFNLDGTKIVFARESFSPAVTRIVVCDSTGHNEKVIASDALFGLLSAPAFNPANSNQVMYRSVTSLKIVDLTSGAETDAVKSNPSVYLTMSTNGKLAVYERNDTPGKVPALFVGQFESSDSSPITHDASTAFAYPQLSLDGQTVICFGHRVQTTHN